MKDEKDYINKIVKNDYSFGTGISAVVNKNIKMKLNEFGEYKPYLIDEKNERSEKNSISILSVCPNADESLNEDDIGKLLYADNPEISYDARVGYYHKLFAGHVVEGDYRKRGSSGGFSTWIFKELLERQLIDGVIHVKENQDPNDPVLFKYDISRTIEEIISGAKTKYYPVELSGVINRIKEEPGRYAIIGIPSFIFSIRLLALQDPIVNDRIRFTIGLICGHQKSAKFAESLAWQVGIEPGKLEYINFRKKLKNEPSNRYAVELIGTKEGKKVHVTKVMSEMIGHDWGQGFFKSNASDYTDDVMNETADVTIGDAWLPEYINDDGGNNVVLVRNKLITDIIVEGINSGKVNVNSITVDTIVKSQSSHFQHTREELAYRLYKKDKEKKWRPKKRIGASNKIPLIRRKIQDMRLEISRESHTIYKEAVEMNDLNHYIIGMQKYSDKYKKIYRVKYIYELGLIEIMKRLFNKIIRK